MMTNHQQIASLLQTNSCRLFQGRTCHPEPEEITKITRLLRQVLLPNYFPTGNQTTVLDCVSELQILLAEQMHRALFQKCFKSEATGDTRQIALDKADEMIAQLPLLQDMLYQDVVETHNGDPAASGYDEIILTYPGILALTVYRAAHIMGTLEIPLLPRMMTEYAHRLTGIDLHPGAQIGKGIMIDHGTGIVIGETAVVGNHVKIYQGVTLGALYFPRDEEGMMVRKTKRHPTVEDHVVLYANATVLGGETVIGHHSVIGSNAWVTDSIDPYSKVLYQTESIVRSSRL